jgi:hypothetical protein
MSLWRQLTRGLRVLTNRTAADQDVADEVQHFLDQCAEAFEARGLSREAARRAARLEIGDATAVREEVRGYGWENTAGALFSDLRYGARRLAATRGFTAITVLTLAIGIGGTTAIFSAVHPILFGSLPYPQADRIAAILEQYVNGSRADGTFALYREFAERAQSFEAVAEIDVGFCPDGVVRQAAAEDRRQNRAIARDLLDHGRERRCEYLLDPSALHSAESTPSGFP